MQNIPNGGRPLRVIRLGRPIIQRPQVTVQPVSESYQEVCIPEIKSYVPEPPAK